MVYKQTWTPRWRTTIGSGVTQGGPNPAVAAGSVAVGAEAGGEVPVEGSSRAVQVIIRCMDFGQAENWILATNLNLWLAR